MNNEDQLDCVGKKSYVVKMNGWKGEKSKITPKEWGLSK